MRDFISKELSAAFQGKIIIIMAMGTCTPVSSRPSPLQRSSEPNSKVRNVFDLTGLQCWTSALTLISSIVCLYKFRMGTSLCLLC